MNNYAQAQPSSSRVNAVGVLSFQKKEIEVDKSCDNKFSTSEAMKNFGKGLASPITSIFSSHKNFLFGAGMIAGSAALVIATGGAAAPLLVAAGVAMGAVQAGKAVYDVANAKNGDDIEKAFFDIGGATSAIGLSAIGAKSSLGQAGVSTEGLSTMGAITKCFTSAKSLAVESFTTFKNGFYKINLTTFKKDLQQPKEFKALAEKLYKEGIEKKEAAFQEIKNIFPEEYHSSLECRVKCKSSIYDKIVARFEKHDNSVKSNAMHAEDRARFVVNDLEGYRYTPKDASPEHIQTVCDYIVKAIEDDKICVTQVKNYTSASGEHYFSTAQCDAIKAAAARRGQIFDLIEKPKSSGYCATQFKIKHKNGAFGELQIRGQLINEVESGEHLLHDLRHGKNIFKGSNQRGELLYSLEKAVRKLTPEEFIEYQEYSKKNYKYARQKEMGLNPVKPELPAKFDKILSSESLNELFVKSKNLPDVKKDAFSLISQLSLYSGIPSENREN